MYLSWLLVDVGENPDRPRPGRLWLRNVYHVHQRICMAFPSAHRVSDDKEFLKPYDQKDFSDKQIHVERKPDAGFLFRIDPQIGGRVVILIQSALKPDWDYAFKNAEYLLAARPESKHYDPRFTEGQRLQFRLTANPTRKIDTKSGPDGKRRNGKRVPVAPDKLNDWLADRAGPAGFSIDKHSITIRPSFIYVNKSRDEKGQQLFSARYEGGLIVTDPVCFKETLIRGIGSGKAYGFGLLSLARM